VRFGAPLLSLSQAHCRTMVRLGALRGAKKNEKSKKIGNLIGLIYICYKYSKKLELIKNDRKTKETL